MITSLRTQDGDRRIGARGEVTPEVSDFIVRTISYGDLGRLVPMPRPPRALAGGAFLSGVGQRSTFQLESRAAGGIVIEQIVASIGSGAGGDLVVSVSPPLPGMGPSNIVNLGSRPVLSIAREGAAGVVFGVPLPLPPNNEPAIFTGLDWILEKGSTLTAQTSLFNTVGNCSFVWHEFETVIGPD